MNTHRFIFLGAEFTLREMQVISLNAHGLYQRQIGAFLQIEESTVKSHMNRILLKLGHKPSTGRELVPLSLANGFDLKGNYNGRYLFYALVGSMPWHILQDRANDMAQSGLGFSTDH